MKRFACLVASLALALLAAGCGGKGSSAEPPPDFKVVAGDASAILTWTQEPDVEYWIFFGPGTGITTTNWTTNGGSVQPKVSSPHVVTGLANGTTYSFTINARRNGGPGGDGAPTQSVVPTLAGANWAPGTPLGTGNLYGIATGNGALGFANIAVGEGGSIFTSINYQATTAATNPSAPADLYTACYAAVGFVAAGAGGTVLYSINGTEWTAQTSNTTVPIRGCATLGTGGFVLVGDSGLIDTSALGTTWTLSDSGTAANLRGVAFGNSLYVVVGDGGTILTSGDVVTWTARASGTTAALRGVAYAALSNTTDSVTVVTSRYVAVGDAGTVLVSDDAGVTWTPVAPFTTQDLTAVTFGGQFVAVGKGGGIFTSLDGLTWTARQSGTTNDLAAIARTLSGYTAVGTAGTNVSSF